MPGPFPAQGGGQGPGAGGPDAARLPGPGPPGLQGRAAPGQAPDEAGAGLERAGHRHRDAPLLPVVGPGLDPQLPVPGAALELGLQGPAPQVLGAVAELLEAAPQVDVDAIAWQRGALPGTPVAVGNNLPGDESALVKGAIPMGPQTNPRQVLALFERFLTALRRDPQLQVTVQQQPFDVESGKALKGGNGESTPVRPEPRPFTILITRRVSP